MKKDLFLALFVVAVTAFLAPFVSSSLAESTASENARTLQMIAPYRSWGKANVEPLKISIDQMAISG